MGRNPNCSCICNRDYNVQKLDITSGKVIWERAVPIDKKNEIHDLYEIRILSDGGYIVCDYQEGTSTPFRGDRRIDANAINTIASASNNIGDPNYTGNYNNIGGWQITAKHIAAADSTSDIQDLIWETDDNLIVCHYAHDMSHKCIRNTGVYSGAHVFYCQDTDNDNCRKHLSDGLQWHRPKHLDDKVQRLATSVRPEVDDDQVRVIKCKHPLGKIPSGCFVGDHLDLVPNGKNTTIEATVITKPPNTRKSNPVS